MDSASYSSEGGSEPRNGVNPDIVVEHHEPPNEDEPQNSGHPKQHAHSEKDLAEIFLPALPRKRPLPTNVSDLADKTRRGRSGQKASRLMDNVTTETHLGGRLWLGRPEEASSSTRRPRARSRGRPDHWKTILGKVRRDLRVAKIECAFVNRADQPCNICASMQLTRSKFLIRDWLPRTQSSEPPQSPVNPEQAGLKIGDGQFVLGRLGHIQAKSEKCPFCRLIIVSLRENQEAFGRGMAHGGDIVDEVNETNAICFATWQVDGRIMGQDKDGKFTGQWRPRTRRIRLRWNWPGFQDSYIVLMASGHAWASDGLFLGRTIESARINPALIQKWVNLCINSHGGVCTHKAPSNNPPPSYFGVIDVANMCLTPLPEGAKYLALSYVWGNAEYFTTKLSNIQKLRVHGGVNRILDRLPRSIKDAIALVKELGERYLWVDALCVIQDSPRSWALNSEVMDAVYGNAFLTICAADGVDANAGLKALTVGDSYLKQNIEQYSEDVRLMSTHPAETYIKMSRWNTRAWTFQERLLSRRCLIFTAGRVYYQCRTAAMSADIVTENEQSRWSIELVGAPTPQILELDMQPLQAFANTVKMYTERHLSYPNDIVAAFKGIGNLICTALGGTLTHCLPSSHFDWALLWEAYNAPTRRLSSSARDQFPSWSWCGWQGEVMNYKPHIIEGCEANPHDWLMHHTWIVWYIRDADGNLRPVWDGNGQNQLRVQQKNWMGYQIQPEPSELYDAYGRIVPEERRELPRDEFQLTIPECPYGVTIADGSRKLGNPDRPYLQFFTWSAHLKLRRDPTIPQQGHGENFRRYSILDDCGDWCGTIVLDKGWAQDTKAEETHSHEFIAISDARNFHKDEYDDWTYYIPKERISSEWDLYYVLLIQKKEIVFSGYTYIVSERVGLGKVFKLAFDRSCHVQGKRWAEFILT